MFPSLPKTCLNWFVWVSNPSVALGVINYSDQTGWGKISVMFAGTIPAILALHFLNLFYFYLMIKIWSSILFQCFSCFDFTSGVFLGGWRGKGRFLLCFPSTKPFHSTLCKSQSITLLINLSSLTFEVFWLFTLMVKLSYWYLFVFCGKNGRGLSAKANWSWFTCDAVRFYLWSCASSVKKVFWNTITM